MLQVVTLPFSAHDLVVHMVKQQDVVKLDVAQIRVHHSTNPHTHTGNFFTILVKH